MATVDLVAPAIPKTKSVSRWRSLDLWLPAGFLIFMVVICFLLPLTGVVPGPDAGTLNQSMLPIFSRGHLLGTDEFGNDMLSRCLYGGRVSIEVGVGAVFIGSVVGGTAGIIAGFIGGLVDTIVMRILDVLLAFPSLILALAVAAYLGPNERDVIFAISFFTIPAYARLARANTLQLRERDFMVVARLIGKKKRQMVYDHIVPNILPSMFTYGFLMVAVSMLIEASLSFLGLGVPLPQPSWGNMISEGEQYLATTPGLVLVPSAFLFLTVLSMNMVGDALRAWWNS